MATVPDHLSLGREHGLCPPSGPRHRSVKTSGGISSAGRPVSVTSRQLSGRLINAGLQLLLWFLRAQAGLGFSTGLRGEVDRARYPGMNGTYGPGWTPLAPRGAPSPVCKVGEATDPAHGAVVADSRRCPRPGLSAGFIVSSCPVASAWVSFQKTGRQAQASRARLWASTWTRLRSLGLPAGSWPRDGAGGRVCTPCARRLPTPGVQTERSRARGETTPGRAEAPSTAPSSRGGGAHSPGGNGIVCMRCGCGARKVPV